MSLNNVTFVQVLYVISLRDPRSLKNQSYLFIPDMRNTWCLL